MSETIISSTLAQDKSEWPSWANFAIYDEVGLWAYVAHQPWYIGAGGEQHLRVFGGRVQFRNYADKEPELVGKYVVKPRTQLNEELTASMLCAMTIFCCEPDGNGNWRLVFTNGQTQLVKFLSDISDAPKPVDVMQKSIAAQIEAGSDGPDWCRK